MAAIIDPGEPSTATDCHRWPGGVGDQLWCEIHPSYSLRINVFLKAVVPEPTVGPFIA